MSDQPKEAALHWSRHKEAAGYFTIKFFLALFKCLPVFFMRVLAFPVGFVYFLFSKRGRTESARFLQRVIPLINDPPLVKKCRSPFAPLRHIISFSLALVEKLQAWSGKFLFKDILFHDDDIGELIRELEAGKGATLIFSHVGNTELLRGFLNMGQTGVSRKIPVVAIMDIKVNANFESMRKELSLQSNIDIISADEIGSHTLTIFEEKIAAGGLVLIAGDRTSLDGQNSMIPFLGKEAPFSSGIFSLTALINAPVYFVFGLRDRDLALKPKYHMYVHKSPLSFDCSRKERLARSSLLARSFAALLETYCKEYPFQWYNFFDFWQKGV